MDRDYQNQRKIGDRIRKFKLQDDKTAVIGYSSKYSQKKINSSFNLGIVE